MTRELLLLRHAKSSWKKPELRDFDRPLNKRGKQDAERMGRLLRERELLPDSVLSSTAKRARATLKRLRQAAGIAKGAVIWRDDLYLAELDALLTILAEAPPAARRVLLIGHNPGLEMLTRHLGGGAIPEPSDGKLVPTAALVRLQLPDDWSDLPAGAAKLALITRPRDVVF